MQKNKKRDAKKREQRQAEIERETEKEMERKTERIWLMAGRIISIFTLIHWICKVTRYNYIRQCTLATTIIIYKWQLLSVIYNISNIIV